MAVHALRRGAHAALVAVFANAAVEAKAALYTELGVSLICDPDGRVQVETRPRGVTLVSEGDSKTNPRAPAAGRFNIAA